MEKKYPVEIEIKFQVQTERSIPLLYDAIRLRFEIKKIIVICVIVVFFPTSYFLSLIKGERLKGMQHLCFYAV